jgi:hypothetical protein
MPRFALRSIYVGIVVGKVALMMEAVRTSEMSVSIYLTTRQFIPEESKLHTRRRENLQYNIMVSWQKESFLNTSYHGDVPLVG